MIDTLRHPVVLIAFVYLAVTVIFQFRPLSARFLDLDRLAILPRWKFFIPQENRLDLRMEMLGYDADSGTTAVPVSLFPARRSYSWLWYPEQHRGEVLWLSTQRLAHKAMRDGGAVGAESVAYQTLLKHVHRSAATHHFERFQFVLIGRDSSGARAERTVFTSQLHTP